MTTQSWSSRIRHDSDANFREWGSDFAARLAAVGMVQTADTGQINWPTVTRAGTNANAGYEIWRCADAMQATAPIFIRVDYGTGSNTGAPRIQVTVGTGSNGSGTITGTALTTARNTANGNANENTDTLRNSYMCHTDGFFGFNWKQGATVSVNAFFFICRTVDSSGVASATGALVVWANASTANPTTTALRFASTALTFAAATNAAAAQICLWPQTPTVSLVGTDLQAAVAFTITPRVEPVVGICGVVNSEFTTGNTFSATLVGSTPRTYMALFNTTFMEASAGVLKPAMLWE